MVIEKIVQQRANTGYAACDENTDQVLISPGECIKSALFQNFLSC